MIQLVTLSFFELVSKYRIDMFWYNDPMCSQLCLLNSKNDWTALH